MITIKRTTINSTAQVGSPGFVGFFHICFCVFPCLSKFYWVLLGFPSMKTTMNFFLRLQVALSSFYLVLLVM